ncbi:nuclear pore complex protein Nup153-like [Cylas formicarius]|uniref:nuclear pore complex protein Nup153-like n=1 Tax=Cylas formicarius TaxID=197179 RepID=UPI00295868FC|nr:nuclear pore complex protein Nup153-like [Cylas formicarius]
MENGPDDSDSKNSSSARAFEDDQSFVGKFKNHVSGIISNTPLSKWFRKQNVGSAVRRRDEEVDEEFYDLQPPTKKTKLPETYLNFEEAISPINNVANRITLKTFPEPVAGPSGYSARKLLGNSLLVRDTYKNGDVVKSGSKDSDSEESTSDYSSAHIGSKDVVSQQSSKQASPLESSPAKLRSLFQNSTVGRTLFTEDSVSPHSSLSSRMPSYKRSSVSSNIADRTISTNKIINSPFYSGKTIYGGASAYGRSINKLPQDLRNTLKNSIQIKPVNRSAVDKSHLQLGKTARRILDTLEQYSTPVMDAKKIPVTPKRFRDGILSKYTGTNPYTIRATKTSSNKELQVPSVTDLLKMKQSQQKSRLQDSTEAVRQIATRSKSVLNETAYKILDVQEQEKHTGKIKSKIGSVRQRAAVHEEPAPDLALNPVALPIKEMPKFNFTIPPSNPDTITLNKKDSDKTREGGTVSKPVSSNNGQYKFSAPLVLGEYLKPLNAYNNFKFSEPLCKKRRSIRPELDAKLVAEKKNNGESMLLKESINATSLEQFKPAKDTWECSVCLIRNQTGKVKCVACETPKPDTGKSKDVKVSSLPAEFSFDETLKPAADTWECPVCMIRNKDDLSKCAACEASKPGSVPKTTTPSKLFAVPPSAASPSGFGDKFAPPPSTWECQICMIRNSDEIDKCAACETARSGGSKSLPPSTFGGSFKKQDNEWECEACMVRNNSSTDKCVCCETPRPGAVPDDPTKAPTIFSFGVDKTTASGFTFGVPPQTQLSSNGAASVFGVKPPPTSGPPSFSFGLPTRATGEAPPKPDPSVAPEKEKKSEVAPLSTTSFGGLTPKSSEPPAVKEKQQATGEAEDNRSSPTPKVAVDKGSTETQRVNPLLKSGEKLPEKAVPAAAGFSFGTPAPSSQTTASTKNQTPAENDSLPAKNSKPVAIATPASTGLFSSPPRFSFKPPSADSKEEIKLTSSPSFTFTPTKSKTISTSLSSQIASPATVTDKPKAPSFKFGSADSSSLRPTVNFNKPADQGGMALFGGPAATPPKPFAFGSSSVAAPEPAKTPAFSFSGTAPAENKPAPSYSFGSASAAPPASEPAKTQSFSFGQSNSVPTFGQSSAFGQNATSVFGQPASNTGPASFGQSTSAVPAFGSMSSATQPAFGLTNSTGQQQSNVFGQTNSIGGFGQTNSATAVQQPAGFGQTAAPSFGFGAKPAETFNQTATAPPNGVFNFGSGAMASNQTTGFSFGAANAAAPPQNSGFNFGSSPAAPATSGGFSFSGAPPTFDANAKPSFNFTGGSGVAFSAPPPTDGGHQPRKFKKAIRRTQVR